MTKYRVKISGKSDHHALQNLNSNPTANFSEFYNNLPSTLNIIFLAYFLEYAIVRTSSVCLFVCRTTTFHGVDRLGRFMARSIAYGPRTQTTEGFFFGPVLDPMGGVWSPNSVYFHINIVFDWYLRRVISLMLDREGRRSKVPPTLKSRYTLWSTYTQWSVKIRLLKIHKVDFCPRIRFTTWKRNFSILYFRIEQWKFNRSQCTKMSAF